MATADQPIRLQAVAKQLGVAPSTPVRWVLRGVVVAGKRVFLAAERIGGVWMTTPAAVAEFRRKLNQASPARLDDRPAARRSRAENARLQLEAELRDR